MTNTEYWTKHHDKYGRSAQALYVDGVTQAVAVRLPGGHPEGLPVLVNLWLIPTYVEGHKVVSATKLTYHKSMQAAKKWAWEYCRELRLTSDELERASESQLLAAWTLSHWQLSRAQGVLRTLDHLKVEADSQARDEPNAMYDLWSRRVEVLTRTYLARVGAVAA